MTRLVPSPPSVPQGTIVRRTRGIGSFGRITALGALLYLLAALGQQVVRAAARLQRVFAAWAERRREREQDRKLWELALSDSRVMADLVALRQDGTRRTSNYF